jgi:hypothetical protein
MKTMSFVCVEVDHILVKALKTIGAHATLEAAKEEARQSAAGWCEDEVPTLFPGHLFDHSLPTIPNAKPVIFAVGDADFGCAVYEVTSEVA